VLRTAELPVAPFVAINALDDLRTFGAQHGFPIRLHLAARADEPHGSPHQVNSDQDVVEAWMRLSGSHSLLLAEKVLIPRRELALVVVRGQDGKSVAYPVVEVLRWKGTPHVIRAHQRGVAHWGSDLGKAVVAAIKGVGAFGVELLELADGELVVGDVSPCAHDAGLFTIEGCLTSQFENHVRAVLGLPLGWPDMVKPAAVTVNCLGVSKTMPGPRDFARALSYRGAHLHWYGEHECREGQKMGHITAIHESLAEAERIARMAASDLMSASAWFV
jgi:5-(carboxyamino)imidazole ribonucleotide synthase